MVTVVNGRVNLFDAPKDGTGWALVSAVAFPNSPTSFRPHFQTVTSDLRAAELESPPETATILLRLKTCTALDRLKVVPSPSSPLEFFPHAQTVPSDFSARVCFHPEEIAVTFVRPTTCTGV